MKNEKIKVTIMDLEDEKGFYDLLAQAQIEAVMSMCPKELRLAVIDNALAILKGEQAVTRW